MTFTANGTVWNLVFVSPGSSSLMRSDGSITIGMTDNTTKTVYLSDRLHGYMLDKVLCHEMTHVYSFENNCTIDIETEEIIADFISLYGRNIIYKADSVLNSIMQEIA